MVKVTVYLSQNTKEELKRRIKIESGIKHTLSSWIRSAVKQRIAENAYRIRYAERRYLNDPKFREKENRRRRKLKENRNRRVDRS